MDLEFSGPLFRWVGPAPRYFVAVPAERCDGLSAASAFVTYGWGMIPVRARIGTTHWKTSLWPKDGVYLLPAHPVPVALAAIAVMTAVNTAMPATLRASLPIRARHAARPVTTVK